MQLTTLRTDARFHVSPQLTATDYSNTLLDANLNSWYRRVLGWIIPIQGDWEIRGDIIYRDFRAGISIYDLPSVLRVFKGEVMYVTAGEFVPLTFINPQRNQNTVEGNSSRTIDDPAAPTADLMNSYIEIKPCIDVTGTDVVNGIKLWVQTDFVTLDTNNDVPDLMEPIHRVLAYGAAYDYCIAEEMWKKKDEIAKIIFGDQTKVGDRGIRGEIEDLYSVRSDARRDRLVAKRGNFK